MVGTIYKIRQFGNTRRNLTDRHLIILHNKVSFFVSLDLFLSFDFFTSKTYSKIRHFSHAIISQTNTDGGSMMEQIKYTISDAAKLLEVESHVLRFWEDELHLTIPRNSMGHRVYGAKEIQQLRQIIAWKKEGLSLKEIEQCCNPSGNGQVIPYPVEHASIGAQDKMQQFKAILGRIVSEAIRDNSTSLTSDIAGTVATQVSKELDFLFREKEDADEKRFRQLDETIRSYQRARQEVAATEMAENKAKTRHFFGKK